MDTMSETQEKLSQNYKNILGRRQLDHDLIFQLRREKVPFKMIALQLGCTIAGVKSAVYRKRSIPIRAYNKRAS